MSFSSKQCSKKFKSAELRYIAVTTEAHPDAVYVGDHKLFTNYYFLNTDKKAFFAAERAR